MDSHNFQPLSLAAFALSTAAVGMSLLALFPWLKGYLIVARDAVLWLALFFVIGGAGFVGWQQMQNAPKESSAVQPIEPAAKPPLPSGFSYDVTKQSLH